MEKSYQYDLNDPQIKELHIDGNAYVNVYKGKLNIYVRGLGSCRTYLDERLFKHDCDKCIFLYRTEKEDYDELYDIYFCNQNSSIDTIIARYGNEGADYISGIESRMSVIIQGKEFSKKLGLIK